MGWNVKIAMEHPEQADMYRVQGFVNVDGTKILLAGWLALTAEASISLSPKPTLHSF